MFDEICVYWLGSTLGSIGAMYSAPAIKRIGLRIISCCRHRINYKKNEEKNIKDEEIKSPFILVEQDLDDDEDDKETETHHRHLL